MKQRLYLCLVLLMLPLFPRARWADSSALIIQGVAGSERSREEVHEMGNGNSGRSCRGSRDSPRIALSSFRRWNPRKPPIEEAFAQLKKQIKPQDNFVLVLIGHGSFDTDYKLNIMGADLTGKEYSALIDSLNRRPNDHHQQHGFQRRNIRNPVREKPRSHCGEPQRGEGRHRLL